MVKLQWNSPFTVLSVENENVPLLSFERIMEIFKRQVFMSVYLDEGYDMTYRVTSIQFSYMRVQVPNSDEYRLVPVWDFSGVCYDAEGKLIGEGSFIQINAIDGTVYSASAGY